MAETSSDEGKQTQNWAHAAILKGERLMARLGARKYLDGLVWKCFFSEYSRKLASGPLGLERDQKGGENREWTLAQENSHSGVLPSQSTLEEFYGIALLSWLGLLLCKESSCNDRQDKC